MTYNCICMFVYACMYVCMYVYAMCVSVSITHTHVYIYTDTYVYAQYILWRSGLLDSGSGSIVRDIWGLRIRGLGE